MSTNAKEMTNTKKYHIAKSVISWQFTEHYAHAYYL
jgi:hypothetical protein